MIDYTHSYAKTKWFTLESNLEVVMQWMKHCCSLLLVGGSSYPMELVEVPASSPNHNGYKREKENFSAFFNNAMATKKAWISELLRLIFEFMDPITLACENFQNYYYIYSNSNNNNINRI